MWRGGGVGPWWALWKRLVPFYVTAERTSVITRNLKIKIYNCIYCRAWIIEWLDEYMFVTISMLQEARKKFTLATSAVKSTPISLRFGIIKDSYVAKPVPTFASTVKFKRNTVSSYWNMWEKNTASYLPSKRLMMLSKKYNYWFGNYENKSLVVRLFLFLSLSGGPVKSVVFNWDILYDINMKWRQCK